MTYPATSRLGRMGPRARAVTEAIEMTLRAELIEALISGEAPPPPPLPKGGERKGERPESIVAVILRMMPELDRGSRKALVKRLMREGLPGASRLSERAQERLRRAVRPGDKRPLYLRLGLPEEIAEILQPPRKELDPRHPADRDWLEALLHEFWPDLGKGLDVITRDDGRPPDSEPGDPEEPEDPGPDDPGPGDAPDPGQPGYATLRLHLERLRCLQSTAGEWREDEIHAGGVATDGPLALGSAPQDANGAIFGPFDLGSFSDGRLRTFGPLRLQEWDLSDVTLPHIFLGLFTLAEIDPAGGFETYLTELLASVEASIPAYTLAAVILGNAASTLGGAGAGFALSLWLASGPVGWIIGGIVVAVLALVGAILAFAAGNMDDIFDLREMLLILDQAALQGTPFHGQPRSETLSFVINGDGGRYETFYHWELADPNTAIPGDQDPG